MSDQITPGMEVVSRFGSRHRVATIDGDYIRLIDGREFAAYEFYPATNRHADLPGCEKCGLPITRGETR